jgi:NAD(P)-dependent dehydrogenase (short-subunit alcohol dehydrogenase family)
MILDRFKLTDSVAIVTGAGKGIDHGIALALAEAGTHVICGARTQADIDDTVADVKQRGGRIARKGVRETSRIKICSTAMSISTAFRR